MADYIGIRSSNPGAQPAGSDIIVAQKADGTPSAYTLTELAAFFSGVSFPQWQTDAANGALVTVGSHVSNTIPMPDGVVTYNFVIRDTGFLTSPGVYTIPLNALKVEISAGVYSTGATPTIRIIKNDVTNNPIAVTQGSGGYASVHSHELDVTAGDTFVITVTGAVNVYMRNQTFFSIRVTERAIE